MVYLHLPMVCNHKEFCKGLACHAHVVYVVCHAHVVYVWVYVWVNVWVQDMYGEEMYGHVLGAA